MVLRGLPVLQRAFGSKRSRGAQRPRRRETRSSRSLELPSEVLALHDVEENSVPQRRLHKEARHGMPWFGGSSTNEEQEQPETNGRSWGLFGRLNTYTNMTNEDLESPESIFFKFYDNKVRELQEKAGDIDHCPISGNLYMYRALAGFGDSSGLFQDKASPLVLAGLFIITLTQALGPVCVLYYAVSRVQFFPNGSFFGYKASFDYHQGTMNHGVSYLAQRVLGVCFLLLFSMNGLYVLRTDKDETKKVIHMAKVFQRAAAVSNYVAPRERWLYIGAFVNSWCLLLCSLCMVFLFIIAEDGPKDVLFDAFGLTFLYNLDDVGGDLAFLDEKWDPDQMGDIYGMLADELDVMEEIKVETEATFTPDNIYALFEIVQTLLVVLLPLAFIFVEMIPK